MHTKERIIVLQAGSKEISYRVSDIVTENSVPNGCGIFFIVEFSRVHSDHSHL